MIIGHGIDLVDLQRFKKMTTNRRLRLAEKICVESELLEFRNSNNPYQYLSKIWAGKEAIAKAFGTGISKKVTWKNIRIKNTTIGKPTVQFKGKTAGPICHLSFSHDGSFLIASAILEMYV